MPTTLEPVPHEAPMVDAPALTISSVWYRYFSTVIVGRLQTSAFVSKGFTLANQSAAIGATALTTGAGGVYRISWMIRITQAASGSSAATVTIAYTDGGVNLTQSGAAVTGNTPTTVQSDMLLVRADAGTAVTYAVAYSSSGATPMQYTLSLAVEQVTA
jgi:hypothetical protein